MSTETLTAALRATNLEPPLASLADRLARVEARMAEAHAAGAGLVVMPEFACARWLSFTPHGLPGRQRCRPRALRPSHLPVMGCRRIRHGGAEAEVWPGSWGADHLRIADPAPPQP